MRVLLPMFVVLALSTGLFGACPIAIAGATNGTPETRPTIEELTKESEQLERQSKALKDAIDKQLPHQDIKLAYDNFNDRDRSPIQDGPLEAFNELRIFALRLEADLVRNNLAYVEEKSWDADFVEIFRRVVTWAEDMKTRPGEYVWRQAKIEEERGLHPKTDRYVGSFLRHLASDKDYPPALYATAINILETKPEELDYAVILLGNIADVGHEAGLRKLIEIHVNQREKRYYPGSALYWIERGEKFGFDMAGWRSIVEPFLTDEDRRWAERFLELGRPPNEWEY